MPDRRHPNVVNVNELAPQRLGAGTRFGAESRNLGLATGAKGVGCSIYEVPPGKAAFPRHFHCANEEALYILDGEGTLRLGDATVAVGPGDFVTFPVGPDAAHQLVNTGAAPLRYLAMSTLLTAEVVGYPDSKKLGVLAAPSREAAMKGQHWIRFVAKESAACGYYDDEDIG